MDSEKKQKMEANGYLYDEELLCFVNREQGKIFSTAWIEGKNLNTIQITQNIPHKPTTWKLFLNPDQPHEELRNALFVKFGNTP